MSDLNTLMNDLSGMERDMKALTERFPSIVGQESVRIIKENFAKQGYDSGNSYQVWKKRSPATNTAYDYNRNASYRTPKLGKRSRYKNPYKGTVVNSKNPILLQTGNLRDSITYRNSGNQIEIGVFPKFISINGKVRNAVDYARIHNEGGQGRWGKHSTKVPKRQFQPRPGEPANPKIQKSVKEKWEFEEQKVMSKWK